MSKSYLFSSDKREKLEFWGAIMGAKAQNHTMDLGPHTGRLNTSEEKTWVPKGLPAQFSWAWRHLKDGPRRNVSSDVTSMAQTCTLPTKRTHPGGHYLQGRVPQTRGKEGNVRCPRRGCNCHIKCVAATSLVALIWREPVNSAVLATTTHKKMEGGVQWDKHSSEGPDRQQV